MKSETKTLRFPSYRLVCTVQQKFDTSRTVFFYDFARGLRHIRWHDCRLYLTSNFFLKVTLAALRERRKAILFLTEMITSFFGTWLLIRAKWRLVSFCHRVRPPCVIGISWFSNFSYIPTEITPRKRVFFLYSFLLHILLLYTFKEIFLCSTIWLLLLCTLFLFTNRCPCWGFLFLLISLHTVMLRGAFLLLNALWS